MDLSIVIPSLNEAHKIDRDVGETAKFLKENNISGEIIIVDDGSSDDTAGVARSVDIPAGVERNVIRYEQNRGKGYAIRTGMKESKGEFAMFADSGLCIPLPSIITGINLIKNKTCDIAHASRRLPQSIIRRKTSLRRQILSLAFRTIIPRIMGIRSSLTDTQCGFKIYRGSVARELYGACSSDGFMFDIEIILRAEKRGYVIHEFPIEWTSDPDTRIRIGRTAERMFGELKTIKKVLAAE
ncbi:MAG: glycosyltransferase [Kiritimatiellae bacterium]|nr:glycosyltransferase [Kiritimatiellia bacterium]MDD5523266.1 glycosyltransferase [Kiritimatiellia bacterium]